MKTVLAVMLFGIAACSHTETTTTPQAQPMAQPMADPAVAATDDPGEPPVDPTLPSWAPRSCSGYHSVVVRALDCTALDAATRDAIKTRYEADHAHWQAMQNEPPGALKQAGADCKTSWQQIRKTVDASCAATSPTASAQ